MCLKELVTSISKKEWRFVILLSIAMILITGLPYVYAYLNAPTGYFYNGIHSLTPGDSPVYFSYINQIKGGSWLVKDNFTHEDQQHGLLNILWLIIGLFARLFNLPADIAFHLSRLILIPVFLFIIYLFFSYIFAEVSKRKLSLVFICFASGLGAYFADIFDKLYSYNPDAHIYYWPVDLWVPEANVFSILYQTPHFICSLSCLIAIFLLMLMAWENKKFLYSFAAGLIGLVWFNFHPFYFPYIAVILFFYLLFLFIKTKKLKLIWHYVIVMILSLPFVVYHYYKIKTDYVIGARASQNVLHSPPFLFVFLGFGFLLIFSVLGIIYLFKDRKIFLNNKFVFLVIWLLAGLVLLYSPIFFQIRFLQGLEIPMVIFSVIFLVDYLLKIPKLNFIKNSLISSCFLFALLFCFSTIFNLTRDIFYFKNHLAQFYLPNEYKEATNWLKNNNPNDQVILSYEYNGQLIPAFANLRVYLAHHIETISYMVKRKKVNDFFTNVYNDEEVKTFFKDNNLKYLFFSDLEKKYSLFEPEKKNYFKKAFEQGQIVIYEFKE